MQNRIEQITDLEALRALSNPGRMRVLALLRNQGKQTVSEVCAATGLAPGSASYHLRRLAEVGLAKQVEDNASDRRKSWWQATSTASLIEGSPKDETSRDMQIGLRQAAAHSYAEAYSRYLANVSDLDETWLTCEVGFDSVLELTPEQAKELGKELTDVIERWRTTHSDADDMRTQKVLFTIQGYPWIS